MIEKFNEWYEGVFDNREQAFGRPVHFIYVRITHVKLDNGFFYGEQQNVWKTYPYRQFVSKPTQEGDKIINKTYRVQGDLHIGFRNLEMITENTVEYREGCDNIISFDGEVFKGSIEGCNCKVERNGVMTYIDNGFELAKDYYNVYDKGVSVETGKQAWGSEHGFYRLGKIHKKYLSENP